MAIPQCTVEILHPAKSVECGKTGKSYEQVEEKNNTQAYQTAALGAYHHGVRDTHHHHKS